MVNRFRSIGGTSLGPLAAILTAAAEYGRERGGFEKLKALNEWLADSTHLCDLFQPTPATRPLLTLLLSLEHRSRKELVRSGAAGIVTKFWSRLPGWVRVVFVVIPGALRDALPLRYWVAMLLGGIVGGALDVWIAHALVGPAHPLARTMVAIVLPIMFVGSYVASVGACIWRLWRLASVDVSEQGADSPEMPGLTEWLHQHIQDLAGLPVTGPPLTVGMLGARLGGGSYDLGGAELRKITTVGLASPLPEDMPVLVLARMSMSFPTLLSAMPLSLPQFLVAIWKTTQGS